MMDTFPGTGDAVINKIENLCPHGSYITVVKTTKHKLLACIMLVGSNKFYVEK